jgi:hypothetical protein
MICVFMRYTCLIIFLLAEVPLMTANQDAPTAKVVAVKKHAEGRIISWQGRIPIFDNYPFYDVTLQWKSKKYFVRYESQGGYYPEAWGVGKHVKVKRERGRFILYNGDEAISAREVNVHDCVYTSIPTPSVTPQVPCD